MMRKLIATAAVALSLAGSFVAASAQSYQEPRGSKSSSQPSQAPSGGGMDRPFHAE